MRADKYLSDAGYGTRATIKKLIKDRKVIVNDVIIKKADFQINQNDIVYVNDEKVKYYENLYLIMNKPAGVVSATVDNIHKTVIDLIKDYPVKNLFPVGRLDIDTVGLLILTTDGNFSHRVTNPKSIIYKTYYAKFTGEYREEIIKIFQEGIALDDEITKPAYFEYLGDNSCNISICEGKFHQVKRMMKAVNLEVIYLKRVKYGSLMLDSSLAEGEYRMLSNDEIELIFK